jgi:hypothetical protein
MENIVNVLRPILCNNLGSNQWKIVKKIELQYSMIVELNSFQHLILYRMAKLFYSRGLLVCFKTIRLITPPNKNVSYCQFFLKDFRWGGSQSSGFSL